MLQKVFLYASLREGYKKVRQLHKYDISLYSSDTYLRKHMKQYRTNVFVFVGCNCVNFAQPYSFNFMFTYINCFSPSSSYIFITVGAKQKECRIYLFAG